MAGQDQRGEMRTETRYVVRIAIYSGPNQKKLLTNYSVNMSTGGLYIETSKIFPADTLLHVEFMLPGMTKSISCRAKVAWTNEEGDMKKPSLPCGMGIQFLTLSLEDMRTIRDFLTHYKLVPTW
ncbi:PilZ domain-containing protein [Geotalea sp. SG265]|uniref:PilZ domain-containing protein n=1 Tax=Geotalea sp. SG265 TaxID=2922867 RepID=UPI001FAFE807|nr:PilZ domain-containing protein [Geotalea sp. SG265]